MIEMTMYPTTPPNESNAACRIDGGQLSIAALRGEFTATILAP